MRAVPQSIVRVVRRRAARLTRTRIALGYAMLMPLLPLVLMFAGERGSPAVGAVFVVVMFQVIAVIPIHYTTSAPDR